MKQSVSPVVVIVVLIVVVAALALIGWKVLGSRSETGMDEADPTVTDPKAMEQKMMDAKAKMEAYKASGKPVGPDS